MVHANSTLSARQRPFLVSEGTARHALSFPGGSSLYRQCQALSRPVPLLQLRGPRSNKRHRLSQVASSTPSARLVFRFGDVREAREPVQPNVPQFLAGGDCQDGDGTMACYRGPLEREPKAVSHAEKERKERKKDTPRSTSPGEKGHRK